MPSLPMPIRSIYLAPRWFRDLCISRFVQANETYGDLWAHMPGMDVETIEEMADVSNYADFARERGAPLLAVWFIQFTAGIQAMVANRWFKDLPALEETA